MKTCHAKTFPETDYEEIVTCGVEAWSTLTSKYAKQHNITYVPSIEHSWDASTRTLPSGEWRIYLFICLLRVEVARV
jgi:hypothetical protein